jgi:hypothetical protein
MCREEQMVTKAKEKVLASTEWLDIEKIVQLSGINERELRRQLHVWKINKKIFSVCDNETVLFPSYAFDRSSQWSPRKGLSLIIKSFELRKSEWGIAIWLAGANSFLGGKRPQDVLDQNIEILEAAIIDELQGTTHG